MISNELLRAKLGFAQVIVKKSWKLYWMGRIVFDSSQIKAAGNITILKNIPFQIELIDGKTTIALEFLFDCTFGFSIIPHFECAEVVEAYDEPIQFNSILRQIRSKLGNCLFVSELKKVA